MDLDIILLTSNDGFGLKTLRYKLFGTAGYIVKDGRKRILNLALAMNKREWVSGLWDRSSSFTKPVKFSPIFEPS